MCGVVGLVYGKPNAALGEEAANLLRKLEYRGYDSTGAAFLDAEGQVVLKKRVGAPSTVIRQLELEREGGVRFIGQVRWATYGSVTDLNAQPHEMSCRLHLVGAHNGNISNTDQLKEFLTEHHHEVRSDNDGEMLVHVVEHEYAELAEADPPQGEAAKIQLAMTAIRRAQERVEGSYAACVAFPDLPGVFAMKSGSSLYAGQGSDAHGAFVVVSSDLTSVLSKTRFLIPLSEGEGLYFTADDYRVFSLREARESKPGLRRSRLNVADVTLQSRYRFFMHQEIYSTGENLDRLIQYYFPEEGEAELFAVFEDHRPACKELVFELLRLYDVFERPALEAALSALLAREDFRALLADADPALGEPAPAFSSDEALLLGDLLELDPGRRRALWLLDRVVVWKKKRKVTWFRNELTELIRRCKEAGGRVFAIGAGTSYHAALVGGCFFNSIAGLAIVPINPGGFRSMYLNSLTEADVLIGVTQSGETKDLLDIFNDVRARYGKGIRLVSLVNNELSTIPQEISDFFLPILCGPEIAVAATKSFVSQLALFHTLACAAVMPLAEVRATMLKVKSTLDFTLRSVEEAVSEVALRLFLKPSMHILGTSLIGSAKEGALKVREVVLNHCEGYDSADFKHGPNTILGKNTIFSLTDLERLLNDAFHFFQDVCQRKFAGAGGQPTRLEDLLDMFKDIGFRDFRPAHALEPGAEREGVEDAYLRYREHVNLERYFSNYPLIFLCAPVERDVKITITQIHTHKIRGADIVLIAQDHEDLRKALEGRPAGVENYYQRYVRVPKLFDANLFPYQAAVVLQLLAFDMSVAKMKYLNKHRVENHGVHPDVPKNVSKSITVD
ncbi:MAG: SIS domain-containing protein [Planctomycetes bacterium]|nr:SIS domain-containing protein [Planctomycetota bacterium]